MKSLVVFFSCFIFSEVALLAGDFWKEKKFTDWSEKEITKMLTKSPWAHRVSVSVRGLSNSQGGFSRGERGLGGPFSQSEKRSYGGFPGSQSGGRGRSFGGGDVRGTKGGFQQILNLTLCWYSALPVRQAIIKEGLDSLVDTSKEIVNSLDRVETHYVIGISGVPIRILLNHSKISDTSSQELLPVRERLKKLFDHIKTQSFLKIKGHEPIIAHAVRVKKNLIANVVDAKAPRSEPDIYFVFPRWKEKKEIITLRHKKVEFVTQIGSIKLKRKFKPKDMVYKGKLEL